MSRSDSLSSKDFMHLKSAIDEAAIVAITDNKGVITYVNKKFCAISKYSLEELIGKTHRVVNSDYHPKEFFIDMWKTIASGNVWEGEIRNRAKDGSHYWVHTTIVPFLNDEGAPQQYVAVRYEITERKIAEHQLKIYADQLALDMEELRDSRAQILQQDRLASLGLLASSLAHEIGTPLGIIRSRAEFISKKAPGNEAVKKDTDVVITQIDRITKLVNSLLQIARGKKSDHTDNVVLNTVLQDVLNLVEHELTRKGIELKLQIPDSVLVRAESGPLGQVFLNLLINAVHAIEEARLKGRPDSHQISISTLDKGKMLEVIIHDSGCGVPEENIPSLYKPFFTTKDIGSGSGLGLATSYKLMESWGGSIHYKRPNGTGAAFVLSLVKA